MLRRRREIFENRVSFNDFLLENRNVCRAAGAVCFLKIGSLTSDFLLENRKVCCAAGAKKCKNVTKFYNVKKGDENL